MRPMGVTEMRLLTMGMAYSRSMAFPVATRSFALPVMRRYMLLQRTSMLSLIQSRREMPNVMVLTSRFSFSIIWLVSITSLMFIMAASDSLHALEDVLALELDHHADLLAQVLELL